MEDVFEYQASSKGIVSVKYAPTGKMFAIATIDGEILIFDMKLFSKMAVFNLSAGPISQIAWGYDSSFLFVSNGAGSLTRLDLESKTPLVIYSNSIPITTISSCRTQFGLACGKLDGKIVFLNRSFQIINEIQAHNSIITSLCYHDSGFNLISTDVNGCIRIWDTISMKCEKSIMLDHLFINSLSFSDKQTHVLVSSTSNANNEGSLTLFSLPNFEIEKEFCGFLTGRTLMQCGFTSQIDDSVYVFSPNIDGNLAFWKTTQEEPFPSFFASAQEKSFIAVSASPTSPFIVTGGGPGDGSVRVFKLHMSHNIDDNDDSDEESNDDTDSKI